MTTLEKVRRLEQYIAVDSSAIDPVIDLAIDKLLGREKERMCKIRERLEEQLVEFEQRYSLKSTDFYKSYETGEMGDTMDFIEWSATIEMLANTEKQITLLETPQS